MIDGDLCEQYPQLVAEKQRSVSWRLLARLSGCRRLAIAVGWFSGRRKLPLLSDVT